MSPKRTAVAVLAVLFPIAAFADISGTLTVPAGSQVSMDTATVVSSGGDFLWSGTTLTPQGSVKAFSNAALSGMSSYNILTQSLISSEAGLGSAAPITGLTANSIVVYQTNGGNFGKLIVTSASGSLVFQYTTYISTTITAVVNNYSLLPTGLPNSGIAPSTIFIIKGTQLASIPISQVTLQPSNGSGIPKSLNSASVSVTVGGTTVTPGLYYAGATQIAAVLPASTPAGSGTVTVTYNGTKSNAFAITVVPSALGLDTYYGTGSGLGVATDAVTGTLITYTNSAKPGENIVLWGSGLGADTADSDTVFTSSPHAVNQPLTLWIGGQQVTPAYAGSSGYPGLNQINLTLPANVATGCGVTVVGQVGNYVTNFMQLPIGQGGGVCNDPLLGYNGTQLTNQGSNSGTYSSGSVVLGQGTSPSTGLMTAGSASFTRYSGFTSSSTGSVVSVGSCYVSVPNTNLSASGTTTGLDAGSISISGPTGTQPLPEFTNPLTGAPFTGTYEATLPNSFIPAGGGTFTATGTGGADVGAFTATISFGALLAWTNQSADAVVNRANGVQFTWTGGASNSTVYMSGTSTSSGASATFVCYAPASAGQFTVPSWVTLSLPASSGAGSTLGIANAATPAAINATGLTNGGAFIGAVSYSINATYN